MTGRLQAIVFDYDGVLADTEPLHLRAFQEAGAAIGVTITSDRYFGHYLGLDDKAIFREIAAERGLAWTDDQVREVVAEKARRFRQSLAEARVLFPSVPARLREWGRRVSIAVASGSPREEIEPVLRAAGLDDLAAVLVALGETPRPKPASDPYLRALELLQRKRSRRAAPIDPSRCVAVEDSPHGIDAAHGAGLAVVALATSCPAARLEAAEAVVSSFDDLDLALLEQVVCRAQAARR